MENHPKKESISTGKFTVMVPIIPMLCSKEMSIPKAHVVVKSTEAFAVTFEVIK